MTMYRASTNLKDYPTPDFDVTQAVDENVADMGILTLSIHHVLTLHGTAQRGFKAIVKQFRSPICSAPVVKGEDSAAYNEALRLGRELLKKTFDETEAEIERIHSAQ